MNNPFSRISPGDYARIIAIACIIFISGAGIIQRYAGVKALGLYACILIFLFLLDYLYLNPRVVQRFSNRSWLLYFFIFITFLILFVIFFYVFPIANSDKPGMGSDRDDALNVAVRELLSGRYPYYVKTYLGNPISPLPGAIILSTPFVLLGNSALQNLFWLPLFFVVIRLFLLDNRHALKYFWFIVLLSFVVLREFVTGGDLLANNLYIFCGLVSAAVIFTKGKGNLLQKAGILLFLGIAFSSRVNLLIFLPLFWVFLIHKSGWIEATVSLIVITLVFALVTVPFFPPCVRE